MKAHAKTLLILSCMIFASAASRAQKDGAETKKSPAADSVKETFTFEDAKVGTTPKGFTVAETKGAGTPASWKVELVKDDAKHKNALKVESHNKEAVFNMLLSEKVYPADLDVSVQVMPMTGEDDQGGGLVWRAKDANNYYIARWNPLEENLRLYKVVQGQRTLLKGVDVIADPLAWHQLGVRNSGQKIQVYFDQKVLLEAEDGTFERGGRIGLWTKSDASTAFDDLNVAWD